MSEEQNCQENFNDIRDAIEKAQSFLAAMTFEQFSQDNKTAYALVRAIEIIGEATKKIPEAVRDQNPQIPW